MPWTKRYSTTVLNWLYPPRCVLCAVSMDTAGGLCRSCLSLIPRNRQGCTRCGAPMSVPGVCGSCQRNPPAFSATYAPFRYEPPLDHLIRQLKYSKHLPVARHLGDLWIHGLGEELANPPQRLVPVPLHTRRLRERGFNHALEITRHLSRALGVPLDYRTVIRTRATQPQATLPLSERRRNIRGAFAVCRKVTWERVAIIDDVMTTGHTANELARVLRRAGARDVRVWVLARA